MNKQIVKTLHTLTGKMEELQQRAAKYADKGDAERQFHEAISDAKRSMIAALMRVPTPTAQPAPQPPAQPADTTMHTQFEQQEGQS